MVWASLFSMFETLPKEINLMDAIRFVKVLGDPGII